MHITQHTDYGLRLLTYLGANSERPVTIGEISERFDISRSHLVKVATNWCGTASLRASGARAEDSAWHGRQPTAVHHEPEKEAADPCSSRVSDSAVSGPKSGLIPVRLRSKAREQEINEGAHFGRKVAGRQIRRVNVPFHGDVFGERRLQPSLLQVGPDDKGGQERDAEAPQHRLRQRLVVVDVQTARYRNRDLSFRAGKSPAPRLACQRIGEAVVVHQVLRRLRDTPALEILRRCA